MNILEKKQSISLDSVVIASGELVSANLDGEVVILGFESGSYYSLSEVGAFVWNYIQKARIVSDICKAILEEYEVERTQCEQDLVTLLNDLAEKQLIVSKEV